MAASLHSSLHANVSLVSQTCSVNAVSLYLLRSAKNGTGVATPAARAPPWPTHSSIVARHLVQPSRIGRWQHKMTTAKSYKQVACMLWSGMLHHCRSNSHAHNVLVECTLLALESNDPLQPTPSTVQTAPAQPRLSGATSCNIVLPMSCRAPCDTCHSGVWVLAHHGELEVTLPPELTAGATHLPSKTLCVTGDSWQRTRCVCCHGQGVPLAVGPARRWPAPRCGKRTQWCCRWSPAAPST